MDDDVATTTDCWLYKKIKIKNAMTTPRVSFYVFFSHKKTVQKIYSQSGTGVGIFPSLVDPILDRPGWEKFPVWAVDFS